MKYFREIGDGSTLIEILGERFDDAMDLMTPNAIVYGGAVRDLLAGKELVGDLDIAVSKSEAEEILCRFQNSAKWCDVKFINRRSNAGGYNHVTKIESVHEFQTMGGIKVQVMVSTVATGNPFEDALEIARNVDMVCCGVGLAFDGMLFETVPGGEEDCKKGVLKINYDSSHLSCMDRVQKRIDHLKGRGWQVSINMKKLQREIAKNVKKMDYKKGLDVHKQCSGWVTYSIFPGHADLIVTEVPGKSIRATLKGFLDGALKYKMIREMNILRIRINGSPKISEKAVVAIEDRLRALLGNPPDFMGAKSLLDQVVNGVKKGPKAKSSPERKKVTSWTKNVDPGLRLP